MSQSAVFRLKLGLGLGLGLRLGLGLALVLGLELRLPVFFSQVENFDSWLIAYDSLKLQFRFNSLLNLLLLFFSATVEKRCIWKHV